MGCLNRNGYIIHAMAAIGHRGPYKPSRPVPCACYPSFAGLHKRLANSLLVEAQSLTVNAEGIEKELKGHYALGGTRRQQKWSQRSWPFILGEPSAG